MTKERLKDLLDRILEAQLALDALKKLLMWEKIDPELIMKSAQNLREVESLLAPYALGIIRAEKVGT